jgi:hypothetical protein
MDALAYWDRGGGKACRKTRMRKCLFSLRRGAAQISVDLKLYLAASL